MHALRRLSLRARVAALLAGLTVALLVVGLVTTLAVARTRRLDSDLRSRLEPASDAAQSLFIAYLDQETAVRGYVLTDDPAFLAPYNDAIGRINGTKAAPGKAADPGILAHLRGYLSDSTVRAELQTVLTLHQQWLDDSATPAIASVKAGQRRNDEQTLALGKTDFDKMRSAVGLLHHDLLGRVDDARSSARDASLQVYYALGVGAIALLVAIVVAGWLLRRWVLNPTLSLQYQLRQVADGGYDQKIAPRGPPELAAVGADAELMRERIVTELDRSRRAIEALYQSGPVVTGLREELAATPALVLPGLALHGVLSAAEGILAGDWYDAVPLQDGRTAVLVADVSGHGAAAGLVALRVKLALTSALSLGLGPAAALAHARGTFASEEERFASCVVVVVDPVGHKLTWANAGHPGPLLFTPGPGDDEEEPVELEPTGPLLSYFEGEWDERTVPFRPGQLLLGYTDGLAEARDPEGRQFEVGGILQALGELPTANPVAAVVACMAAVRSHAVDLRRDDVTVVAVAHEG
jgi:serine phosphatase RsbU (regulator of sigma subunit)/CHASE3 domain sensor protein